MIEMSAKQIIPAEIRYASMLSEAVLRAESAGVSATVQRGLLSKVTDELEKMQVALVTLEEELKAAQAIKEHKTCAFYYRDHVKTAMEALRAPADALEMLTDKDVWPIPTYGDLLFEV